MRKHSENAVEGQKLHFVYAGDYYSNCYEQRLLSPLVKAMKKTKTESVMVTIINIWRFSIINKKAAEWICKGNDYLMKDSVNDDLESLFERLRLGKAIDNEIAYTYFLPKLTDEELDLVEKGDTSCLQTFRFYNIDQDWRSKLMLCESNSKFIKGVGFRRTFEIGNLSTKKFSNLCFSQ